jgi:hypothetical protein
MRVYFDFIFSIHKSSDRRTGLMFHRWLPNGESDAIQLASSEPVKRLTIWLPRRGHMDGNEVRFDPRDPNRSEIDESRIERQGVLTAAVLAGSFESVVNKKLVAALTNGYEKELPEYLAFGRRIVKALHSSLDRFANIVRLTYGQYWLKLVGPWDSRGQSLGNYTRGLGLRWSLDRKEWHDFKPDKSVISLIGSVSSAAAYRQFLTVEDWKDIGARSRRRSDREPPPEALLVASARQLLQDGSVSHALIETATALEVAVNRAIKEGGKDREYQEAVKSYYELPLLTKATLCLVLRGRFSNERLMTLKGAIKLRNAFAHDGEAVQRKNEHVVYDLLEIVALLVPDLLKKVPDRDIGNTIMDDWENSDLPRATKRRTERSR